MSIEKPVIGEPGWGLVLNAALDELDEKETIEGAETKAAQAYSSATEYTDARLNETVLVTRDDVAELAGFASTASSAAISARTSATSAEASAASAALATVAPAAYIGSQIATGGTPAEVAVAAKIATVSQTITTVPGESATATTARINAALATANPFGVVRTVHLVGDFVINAPLVLRSRTVLDMASATLTPAVGWTESNLITNEAAVTPFATVTDAAVTAGSNVVTSPGGQFTPAMSGKQIAVEAAGISAFSGRAPYYGTFNYVDANNGTISQHISAYGTTVNATVTVSGKPAKIWNRDVGITIRGGVIDRRPAPTTAPDGNVKHVVLLRRIDRLTISDQTIFTANAKYGHSIADVTDLVAERLRYPITSSDGFHLIGPVRNAAIRDLAGTTHDDLFSITAADFSLYSDTSGDIVGVTVDGLHSEGAVTAWKTITGDQLAARDIKGSRITGWTTTRSIVITEDFTGVTDVDIKLTDVDIYTTSDTLGCIVIGASAARNVHIDGFATRVGVGRTSTANPLIRLDASPQRMVVEKVRLSTPAATGQTWAMLGTFANGSTTTPELVLKDWQFKAAGGNGFFALNIHTPITRLSMSLFRIENLASLIFSDVTTGTMTLTTTDLDIRNVDNVIQAYGNTIWNYAATVLDTFGAYFRSRGSATRTHTMRGSGLTGARTPTAAQVSVSGSTVAPTFRIVDDTYPIDVGGIAGASGYVVAKNNGDKAWNTNATTGGSTIGTGPCDTNGSNWKNRYSAAVL